MARKNRQALKITVDLADLSDLAESLAQTWMGWRATTDVQESGAGLGGSMKTVWTVSSHKLGDYNHHLHYICSTLVASINRARETMNTLGDDGRWKCVWSTEQEYRWQNGTNEIIACEQIVWD